MARTKQTSRRVCADLSTGGAAPSRQLATKAARKSGATHRVNLNPKTKKGRANLRLQREAEKAQEAEWDALDAPEVWTDDEDEGDEGDSKVFLSLDYFFAYSFTLGFFALDTLRCLLHRGDPFQP